MDRPGARAVSKTLHDGKLGLLRAQVFRGPLVPGPPEPFSAGSGRVSACGRQRRSCREHSGPAVATWSPRRPGPRQAVRQRSRSAPRPGPAPRPSPAPAPGPAPAPRPAPQRTPAPRPRPSPRHGQRPLRGRGRCHGQRGASAGASASARASAPRCPTWGRCPARCPHEGCIAFGSTGTEAGPPGSAVTPGPVPARPASPACPFK